MGSSTEHGKHTANCMQVECTKPPILHSACIRCDETVELHQGIPIMPAQTDAAMVSELSYSKIYL